MKKKISKKHIICSGCIFILLAVVVICVFMIMCLERGRERRLFAKQVINQECIWKAEEIDCVLYANNTSMYKTIKEKYQIDDENHNYIFGIFNIEDEIKPVILSRDLNGGYFSETYFCDEWKILEHYQDEYFRGEYKINFWKNEFVLTPKYTQNNGNNSIFNYLSDNGIEKITFTKHKEESHDINDIIINTETNKSLFNRYEKNCGVNVLSAKYNHKKHQMEISVRNENEFDINEVCLMIGIIGKTEYELSNNWKYEDILSYEEGHLVRYYSGGIKARSIDKIIIPKIKDEAIYDIMACVESYEYNNKHYNNSATTMFYDFVNKANEDYFRNLIN